jgi:DNA-binding response OmpR family regulator
MEPLACAAISPVAHVTSDSDSDWSEDRHATVLVVEDNDAVRAMLARLLSTIGLRCIEARSAEQAIDLMATESPIACVIDLGLPGMNGAELARHMRRDHDGVVLVAVSGLLGLWDVEDLRNVPFDQVFAKPFDTDGFVAFCRGLWHTLRHARR